MIILGLSHLAPSGVGHDSTAALFVDGDLRSAISEERFTRLKILEAVGDKMKASLCLHQNLNQVLKNGF